MKDIFLTPRGDLAIEDIIDSKQRLEINFLTSKSNALRFNFFVEDTFEKQALPNSLQINFKTEKPINNKEVRMVTGNAAIEQAIKIRLLTALGSLRGNSDIGSKIELVIHQLIDNESTLLNLEKYIKQAIKDIISNPIIKISNVNSKYIDYSDKLKIVIIDKDVYYTVEI